VRAFSAAGGKIIVKSETAIPKKGKSAKKPAGGAVVFEAVASR
jgi:hypothetical protein